MKTTTVAHAVTPLPIRTHPRDVHAPAVRWGRRFAMAVPAIACVAGAAIVTSTAWHAVSVVRPPRVSPDTLEIDQELPGSERVSFLGPDGVTLVGNFVPPKNGAVIVLAHGLFASRRQLLPEAQLL